MKVPMILMFRTVPDAQACPLFDCSRGRLPGPIVALMLVTVRARRRTSPCASRNVARCCLAVKPPCTVGAACGELEDAEPPVRIANVIAVANVA